MTACCRDEPRNRDYTLHGFDDHQQVQSELSVLL